MKDNVSGKNVTIVSVCLITLLTLMGCGNSPFEKNNLPKENVEFPSTYEKEIERVTFHTQLVIPEEFLLTLMGCGNSPFEKNNLPKENVEFPSTYEKEIERVTFHTQLVIPEEFNQDMLMKTTARKKILNIDKVKKDFEEKIQGQTVKEKFDDPPDIPEEFNQDMLMKTTARKKILNIDKVKKDFEEKIQGQTVKEKFDDPPEKKGAPPYYHILTEEGTSFSVTDGIQFTTGNGYFFNGVLLYDDNGNLPEEYSEAREVTGLSEDKAWKIEEEELYDIGYEI